MSRFLHLILLALTAVAGLGLAGVAGGQPGVERGAGRDPSVRTTGGGERPPKADRDGNDLFDDLERELQGAPETKRVKVIVRLSEPASEVRIQRLKRDVGEFSVKDRFGIVRAFAATVSKRQAQALARRADVLHVEEDSPVRALNGSAQSSFGVTKARGDAPGLDGDADGNPTGYSKDDLVAAVLDTGIDTGHEDLDEGKVIAFKDFVNGRASAYDDEGHGTHVAGTIAGDGDARSDRLHKGVAPEAALVGVKVLDQNGDGLMSDVTAGIDWVVANKDVYGIEAINLSLGAAGCSDGTDADSLAVNNAHDQGIVVAVAAGNEGPGTCTISSPGAAQKALTVGAMADMGEKGFYQAYFSSRGKTADGRIKPDISAPGVNVTSAQFGTATGYAASSGTSMATPFAAGLALLMRDATPTLTSQQVKDKAVQTAIDWGRGGDNKTAGSSGPDIDYGAGRLDGYAALKAAGAPIDAPPAMPAHHLREGSLSGAGQQADHAIQVRETKFPIAATMHMAGVTSATSRDPNFNIYLLDPSGTQVASSEFLTRQDEVFFQPTVTGTYTVRVRSARGSGSYFVDISAPTEDTTAPETSIDSGPSGTTGSSSAELAFSSEANSTLQCRLDGGSWSACGSPKSYTRLRSGPHSFEVRAADAGGNVDPTPASRNWTVGASAYRDAVVAMPSLVSYWRLGEGSGTKAVDQQLLNHGAYGGGVGLGAGGALAGDPDTGARFDGVDDLVRVPHSGGLDPDSITVEGWARSDGSSWNNNGWFASKRDKFVLHPQAGSREVRWYVQQAGGGWRSVSYVPADITVWHHYAGTYDASSGRLALYVDGQQVAAANLGAAQLRSSSEPLSIGADSAAFSSRKGKGWLDEVALYSSALSSTDLRDHYDAGG